MTTTQEESPMTGDATAWMSGAEMEQAFRDERPKLSEAEMRMLLWMRRVASHRHPHDDTDERQAAYARGWAQTDPEWSGLTQLTDAGWATYQELDRRAERYPCDVSVYVRRSDG